MPYPIMRALVVTHGNLGKELLDSARCIYAVEAPIEPMSNRGLDAEALRSRIAAWLGDGEDPVIVFVDVGGGSCGVAAQLAVANRPHAWVIGGVNLAMVLTYLSSHSQLGPEDLVSKILDRALNAVRILERGD